MKTVTEKANKFEKVEICNHKRKITCVGVGVLGCNVSVLVFGDVGVLGVQCLGVGVGVQCVWGVGVGVSCLHPTSTPSPNVSIQHASVCAFKTSPCLLGTLPHAQGIKDVLWVHTETFSMHTRRRFESTHGKVENNTSRIP